MDDGHEARQLILVTVQREHRLACMHAIHSSTVKLDPTHPDKTRTRGLSAHALQPLPDAYILWAGQAGASCIRSSCSYQNGRMKDCATRSSILSASQMRQFSRLPRGHVGEG